MATEKNEQIKNIEERLDRLESINRKKIASQNILFSLFIVISIFLMLITSLSEVGSFVSKTERVKDGNITTIISSPIIVKEDNITNKKIYLRDNTTIYYGFFILLSLILIIISFDNRRYEVLEDE